MLSKRLFATFMPRKAIDTTYGYYLVMRTYVFIQGHLINYIKKFCRYYMVKCHFEYQILCLTLGFSKSYELYFEDSLNNFKYKLSSRFTKICVTYIRNHLISEHFRNIFVTWFWNVDCVTWRCFWFLVIWSM